MDGMEAGAVLRAARAWPARERAILVMKYADGLSNEEIAAALDAPEPEVEETLRRIRERAAAARKRGAQEAA